MPCCYIHCYAVVLCFRRFNLNISILSFSFSAHTWLLHCAPKSKSKGSSSLKGNFAFAENKQSKWIKEKRIMFRKKEIIKCPVSTIHFHFSWYFLESHTILEYGFCRSKKGGRELAPPFSIIYVEYTFFCHFFLLLLLFLFSYSTFYLLLL